MVDLSKSEQPEGDILPEKYREIGGRIAEALCQMWEGVKRFVTDLWRALKRTVLKAYTAFLEGRIEYYGGALRVTKKTVARRQLIKKQVSLREMLQSIEGGARYG